MVFMDEKDIKRAEDYLSLKKRVMIKYSLGDGKSRYAILVKTGHRKIIVQQLGDYGRTIIELEDIAKEDLEIANFEEIGEFLKKKSKK